MEIEKNRQVFNSPDELKRLLAEGVVSETDYVITHKGRMTVEKFLADPHVRENAAAMPMRPVSARAKTVAPGRSGITKRKPTASVLKAELRTRLRGLFAIALGLAFGYFFAYLPIQEAQHHKSATITTSGKAACVAVIGVFFGVYMLIFGQAGMNLVTTPESGRKRLNFIGWVLALITVAVSFAFYGWVQHRVESYGYHY
jgi:hypothetical protein